MNKISLKYELILFFSKKKLVFFLNRNKHFDSFEKEGRHQYQYLEKRKKIIKKFQ
jgi:hypothetical protein